MWRQTPSHKDSLACKRQEGIWAWKRILKNVRSKFFGCVDRLASLIAALVTRVEVWDVKTLVEASAIVRLRSEVRKWRASGVFSNPCSSCGVDRSRVRQCFRCCYHQKMLDVWRQKRHATLEEWWDGGLIQIAKCASDFSAGEIEEQV